MCYFKYFIYLFLERGREGERGREIWMRERNIDWLPLARAPTKQGPNPQTQACALSGNQTRNLSVCRMMPNPQSHTSQGVHVSLFILNKQAGY